MRLRIDQMEVTKELIAGVQMCVPKRGISPHKAFELFVKAL